MFRPPITIWAKCSAYSKVRLGEASTSNVTLTQLSRCRRELRLASSYPTSSTDQPQHTTSQQNPQRRDRASRETAAGSHGGSVALEPPPGRTKGRPSRSAATSPSSSSIYPNSKASLRPNANSRSPLFASRLILKNSAGAADSNGPSADKDDRGLYAETQQLKQLHQRKTAGDVEGVVRICNSLAEQWYKDGTPPSYKLYHALLETLSFCGLIEESYQVLEDMHRSGLEPDPIALNFTLKAAALSARHDDVVNICARINHRDLSGEALPQSPKRSAVEAPSNQDSLAIPALLSTRNLNSFSYTCLFNIFFSRTRPEEALLCFSALARSRPTSAQAFADLLTPAAAKFIIELLLQVHEYRLAVEIAEWIHIDGAGRLVSPTLWMEIAAGCAVGNYYPGLKHAFQRAVTEGGIVMDEGFLIAALGAASRAPDSEFCFKLLKLFLISSTQWTQMRIPDTTPPPVLHHPHLLPLVEALTLESKFEEAMRLMGAIEYWGIPLHMHSSLVLTHKASINKTHLQDAVDAWQRVIAEGKNLIKGEPLPLTSPEGRSNVLRRVAEGRIPALAGRIEVHTMNALIEAAARLGEDDLALKIWENQRLANMRPSLSRALRPLVGQLPQQSSEGASSSSSSPQSSTTSLMGQNVGQSTADKQGVVAITPTVETFNSLLKACMTSRIPSIALSQSIFTELQTKHKSSVKVNATTYEYLIKILLLNLSSGPLARVDNDLIRRALLRLEACKAEGLIPTAATYEVLILSFLRDRQGPNQREDPRWWRMVEEMTKEAGHPLSIGLLKKIRFTHRYLLWKTDGAEGLTLSDELHEVIFQKVILPERRKRDARLRDEDGW